MTNSLIVTLKERSDCENPASKKGNSMKIKAAFFNPTRNLEDFNLSEQRRPVTLKESNALYTTLVKRAMNVLIGVNKNVFKEKDKYDLMNFDPFFSLSIDFIEIFKKTNPNKEIPPNKYPIFHSNLGLFHYVNIFVPLTLLCELAALKMKEKALEKFHHDEGFKKNMPLLITSYGFLSVFGSHLLILSILTHSWFAVIQALLAITLVTLTSAIWYPIALAKTMSPVEYDIAHYDSKKDDYKFSSSTLCSG